MPSMKICKCGKLVNETEKMCQECEKRKGKADREYNKKRGTSTERGYDAKWRRYRIRYLMQNPLCVECMKENKYTPATVVDHIIPHKGDKKLFWDTKNHQSMCKRHHDIKTAKEDGGFGNR